MELEHLHISKSVRVWVHGDPRTADNVWIALHGYAQQAEGFAQVLEVLANESTAVLIPEGPHRFYIKGFSGDVGASWMTREDRLEDIKDYILYLDSVFERWELGSKQVSVLGFSQGAATATRWVCRSDFNFHHLVLWAGVVPPDLDLNEDLPILRDQNISFVLGDEDEFISNEKVGLIKGQLEDLGLSFSFIPFKGKHRLNRGVLKDLNHTIFP